jgi:hypothetical protein
MEDEMGSKVCRKEANPSGQPPSLTAAAVNALTIAVREYVYLLEEGNIAEVLKEMDFPRRTPLLSVDEVEKLLDGLVNMQMSSNVRRPEPALSAEAPAYAPPDMHGEKCLLCRRPLGEGSKCRNRLCLGCADEVDAYLYHFHLEDKSRALAIEHLWAIGSVLNRYGHPEQPSIPELRLLAPTYYGATSTENLPSPNTEEFDAPFVPVLAQSADGIRVVLGSHDWLAEAPDIAVERRSGGWLIFLHPAGGGDESGFIIFLDDGRSYLIPEGTSFTERIELRRSFDEVPELDARVNESVSREKSD